MKNVVIKDYCDSNLLSSSNKIHILSKRITQLSKSEFDKITTKTLKLNKTQVLDEQINELIKSVNEYTNKVNFCNKVASYPISKYNQLKLEFATTKFNQNISNIRLGDIFTTGLREFKEVNEKTSSAIDEALVQTRKTIIH